MVSSNLPYQTIHAAPLRDYSQAIFEAVGVAPNKAWLIADSFVAANLRAVDSHGVQLIPPYIEAIRRDYIDINADGRVATEAGACLVYDGENAFGQTVSNYCCDHAIRLAQTHGVSIVTARESNHFGAAAYWAQKISAQGLLAIVTCNASPLVVPWQGREPKLGTNPICLSVPGPDTFLLDMATTTVALNRIFKAAMNNEDTIPAGWAVDQNGVPTTDTQTALAGSPMPLGGYKGTGLGAMVEILCAVLSGGAMLTEVCGLRKQGGPMRVGHFFLALDVTRFLPMDDFIARMQKLHDVLKSSAPATGYDEVLVAGEPEWRAEEQRQRDGIPIPLPTWEKLGELATSLGVVVPSAL